MNAALPHTRLETPCFRFLTFQTTTSCNLRCSYCYVSPDQNKGSTKLSEEAAELAISRLIDYRKQFSSNIPISITFHGGEALLLGKSFYKNVLSFISSIENRNPNIKIHTAIQTNLTLLNEDYCQLFKDYRVGLGTSIDGPPQLHNIQRRSIRERDNHSLVMKKVDLARSFGLDVGAICVITRNSLEKEQEIFDFFEKNRINFKINNLFRQGDALDNADSLAISSSEYADFSCKLFDLWYTGAPSIEIESFTQLINLVLNGAGSGGCEHTICADSHLTVTPRGEYYTCGRVTDIPFFKLGDVRLDTLSSIASNEKMRYLLNRHPDRIENCKQCKLKLVCMAGCMQESYLENKSLHSPGAGCDAFKAIFTHVESSINGDLDRFSIN